MGDGPARLAHRVLGHVAQVPGPAVRHPRRRCRPRVPAPRERARAERGRVRLRVREPLDARRHAAGELREDEQVARQLQAAARRARDDRSRRAALPHAADALPQPARLLRRTPGRGRRGARAHQKRREEPRLAPGQRRGHPLAARRARAHGAHPRGEDGLHPRHGRRLQHVQGPRGDLRLRRRRERADGGQDPCDHRRALRARRARARGRSARRARGRRGGCGAGGRRHGRRVSRRGRGIGRRNGRV